MNAGVVYLIHLSRPLGDLANPRGQAQHYLGWAKNLEDRIREHRSGAGARLLAVANQQGIAWEVVRTWPGSRELERRLKHWHKHRQLCPICRGEISESPLFYSQTQTQERISR